jgi:hypothetical protein
MHGLAQVTWPGLHRENFALLQSQRECRAPARALMLMMLEQERLWFRSDTRAQV